MSDVIRVDSVVRGNMESICDTICVLLQLREAASQVGGDVGGTAESLVSRALNSLVTFVTTMEGFTVRDLETMVDERMTGVGDRSTEYDRQREERHGG